MKHQRHKDFCADSFRRAMGLLFIIALLGTRSGEAASTGAAVKRYVAADPNAIGYIDLAEVDESVRAAF